MIAFVKKHRRKAPSRPFPQYSGLPDLPTHILKFDIKNLPISPLPLKTRILLAMSREGIVNVEDVLLRQEELPYYRNLGRASIQATLESISTLDYLLRHPSADE